MRHIGRRHRQGANGIGAVVSAVGGVEPDNAVHRLGGAVTGFAQPAGAAFKPFCLLPALGKLRSIA
ncbi:hypothetical protein AB6849_15535 [Serratia proteamaculans]|uniref:hypothetical protein n=1 Tax=Serratia proteamaculans TaxID=28151 RepID=UPI0021A80DA1|nr:hypothetical protein [Serratia proteamaculans]WEO92070.1 hypothetical protein JET59_013000 [Serratia proteamaculans]